MSLWANPPPPPSPPERWPARAAAWSLSFVGVLLCSSTASAEPASPGPSFAFAVDAQYYAPIHEDRPVRSVFLDLLVGKELVSSLGLSGYIGLTFTHAWGAIIQYGEHFEDLRLATSAVGAGGLVLLRMQPLRLGPVALGGDAVGSLLFYDHDFPPGGDVYNFSWRAGPSLSVRLAERLAAVAGYRWMHVSNGQGLGPQNPSYAGRGLSLGVVVEF